MTESVEITIAKAGPIAGESPQDVCIKITGEPPEFSNMKEKDWREKYDAFYNEQSATLGKALLESLPGATVDRLLIWLDTQKRSYFRVPYVEPREARHLGDLLEACQPFIEIADYGDKYPGVPSTFEIEDAKNLRAAYNKFLK